MNVAPPVLTPTRVCICGEDLDWIGGRSVCAGIDLFTHVQLQASPPPSRPAGGMTFEDMYAFLRRRNDDAETAAPPARIDCRAPSPGGLGTSSSICLGYYTALQRAGLFPNENMVEAAYQYEYETTQGGGMDHLAIALGGWVLTDGRDGDLPRILAHTTEPHDWTATIIHSRMSKSCGASFQAIREKLRHDPHHFDQYRDEASQVSMLAWDAIETSDLDLLGLCLTEAHRLMRDVRTMSNDRLESLRITAEHATGLAFKLTGSGSGGCLFTINTAAASEEIRSQLHRADINPADIYQANITKEMMT